MIDVADVIKGYCVAALWADAIPLMADQDHPEHDDYWESGGMNDSHAINSAGMAAISPLIKSWCESNADLLQRYEDEMTDRLAGADWSVGEQAGHDLRLTAGGHGTGFWDRGLPDDLGQSLSDLAQSFGDIECWEVDAEHCTFSV
jgi:hypothetical protein